MSQAKGQPAATGAGGEREGGWELGLLKDREPEDPAPRLLPAETSLSMRTCSIGKERWKEGREEGGEGGRD